VITNEYSWTQKGTKDKKGTQIDFIIDRADNCINILEIKYQEGKFEVTKQYAAQLREKIQIFKNTTATKKNIFLTMLTIYGTKVNEHFLSTITNQLTIEDLFV
ncbi:MAG: ATPase, partial [Bacteroidota bacterium]